MSAVFALVLSLCLVGAPAKAVPRTLQVEPTVDRTDRLWPAHIAAASVRFESTLRARGFSRAVAGPHWAVRLTMVRATAESLEAEALVLSPEHSIVASLRASGRGAPFQELIEPVVDQLVNDVARVLLEQK